MRNERLLDALETFLGPEISVSSRYHLNLKLSRRHMAIAASIAAAVGQIVPQDSLWNFHIGTTNWHRDAPYGWTLIAVKSSMPGFRLLRLQSKLAACS
jgi:hypothetical protein